MAAKHAAKDLETVKRIRALLEEASALAMSLSAPTSREASAIVGRDAIEHANSRLEDLQGGLYFAAYGTLEPKP